MSIYIMTHKEINIKLKEFYNIMLVGAYSKEKTAKNYIRDDTLDNISNKNSSYCELTGLYWLWKNCNDDIIGLVHYRRFFYKKWVKISNNEIIDKNIIEKKLKKYDIIAPAKSYYTESLREQYCNSHYKKDLDNIEKILDKYYPEYKKAYNKVMKKNTCYAFNMFIMKKDLMNEYCKWLFDILFKLEEITDTSEYDEYQKRIYGFLSERLFNVWIKKNNYKVKTYPVFNNEDSDVHTSKLYNLFRYAQSYVKSKIHCRGKKSEE